MKLAAIREVVRDAKGGARTIGALFEVCAADLALDRALAAGDRLAVRAGLARLARAAGWRPLDARSLSWLTS